MTKIVQIEITGCHDCPFKEYDPNYNIGYDSGHDCCHDNVDWDKRRIANDGELTRNEKSLSGFPDFCPLRDPELGFYMAKIPVEEV